MKEKNTFTVINNEGKEVLCDVLFTFDSKDTNKSYIVYTDNTKDDMGNIKVYANTYDSNKDNGCLGTIETDEEWAIIEQIFSSINNKGEDVNG